MLTWELLGALVGAGFASGREIAAFFACYGVWGYVGAAVAAITLTWLADTGIPMAWQNRWQAYLWRWLLSALLIATGGAMLSGAGEIAKLVVPVHAAYWVGIAGTLILTYWLAYRLVAGLSWVSKGMFCVLLLILAVGLLLPEKTAAMTDKGGLAQSVVRASCYGGFNAALLIPVLNQRKQAGKRRSLICVGWIVLGLLVAGISVLLRHPQLIQEPLPFVRLLESWGKVGYLLSAGCLYLAILSTLTACLRGLGKPWFALPVVLLVALIGFQGVVNYAYTLLGGSCSLMLLAAKFRNCARKAFISGKDML